MEKLKLKMDEVKAKVKAKGTFSLIVTIAKVVGPLIVLVLIVVVLFPKEPESIVVEKEVVKEVPVEVVKEVEKSVVQTVVVEKEVEKEVVASPTPVPPTPTPVPPTVTPVPPTPTPSWYCQVGCVTRSSSGSITNASCRRGELKDGTKFCCLDWYLGQKGDWVYTCMFEDGEKSDKPSSWLIANSVFWTTCQSQCE